jgi:hypothetical protein
MQQFPHAYQTKVPGAGSTGSRRMALPDQKSQIKIQKSLQANISF